MSQDGGTGFEARVEAAEGQSSVTLPWSALDRAARVVRTPCGDGTMVWRMWGAGEKLVLLHGGAGSWLHWIKTIEDFRDERLVVVPDLPGLGGSADLPEGTTDGGASVVAAGLEFVLGEVADADLVGFSFGGVIAGMVAARLPVRSVTLVGSGGLGAILATAQLERVRDKRGAAREAAHRTNLERWMIADPARIDATAIAIQDWNSRHARLDSRKMGRGNSLLTELPGVSGRIAGIWGEFDHSVQGATGRPQAALETVRPGTPFEVVPDAGHWVAYEAPEAFAAALRRALPPSPHATERDENGRS